MSSFPLHTINIYLLRSVWRNFSNIFFNPLLSEISSEADLEWGKLSCLVFVCLVHIALMSFVFHRQFSRQLDRKGSTDNMSITTSQPCKQERKGSFFKVRATPIIISVQGKINFAHRTVRTVGISHSVVYMKTLNESVLSPHRELWVEGNKPFSYGLNPEED